MRIATSATCRIGALAWAALSGAVLGLGEPAAARTAGLPTGGTGFVPSPKLERIVCESDCGHSGRPRAGATIALHGSGLKNVTRVIFEGREGSADNVRGKLRARGERSIKLEVPLDARSGPVRAWATSAVRSAATKRLRLLPAAASLPNSVLSPASGPRDPGAPRLQTATSRGRTFLGWQTPITFSYRVSEAAPASIQVDLVRLIDRSVVRSWNPAPVASGEVQSLTWDGLGSAGPPPEGRYAFRLVAVTQSGAQARSAQIDDPQRDAFDFYQHIFPVRASHDFGGPSAAFGAERQGHAHQGQDILAACGAKLVAARGGVVKFSQYHAAAGHYLVIAATDEGIDYAYMHLAAAAPVSPGSQVRTGQQIGNVGDSGDAEGCHLHFEMWSAPGWYDGGASLDPLPSLRGWDAFS